MALTASDRQAIPWEPVRGPRVVVGVDGSPGSADALAAAARAATLMSVPLVVFTVWSGPGLAGLDVEAELDEAARRVQDEAVRAAFADAPAPQLHTAVRRGGPAQVLIRESQGASLLVVGSRGTGGFPGLQLGSTGIACAARALCPVLVVKRPPRVPVEGGSPFRVVVGVDGSQPSLAALRVAVGAADRLHGRLDVVTVWQPLPGGRSQHDDEIAAAARVDQSTAVAEVLQAPMPEHMRTSLHGGSPAGILVDSSADADLLVVGSRAQGTVSGVLFGGVTMICAQHAVPDVLIIHAPDVPES